MDTNVVVPTGPATCRVLFDYYVDPARFGDREFIESSLRASDAVQQEDIQLCHRVQEGLSSPAYDVGRYAPGVEGPMFHFHQLLYAAAHGREN